MVQEMGRDMGRADNCSSPSLSLMHVHNTEVILLTMIGIMRIQDYSYEG